MFVTSFIDSLAMNLLEGRLSDDGAIFAVAGDGSASAGAGRERLEVSLLARHLHFFNLAPGLRAN